MISSTSFMLPPISFAAVRNAATVDFNHCGLRVRWRGRGAAWRRISSLGLRFQRAPYAVPLDFAVDIGEHLLVLRDFFRIGGKHQQTPLDGIAGSPRQSNG